MDCTGNLYSPATHKFVGFSESEIMIDLESYAMEELCAEIGAAFLCADLGITPETRDDHAAYIQSWLKVLKDDKRAIFTAASHAQKAADYLHGLQPQADTEAEERQEEEALA
jgi:antirestriction protein ArdC